LKRRLEITRRNRHGLAEAVGKLEPGDTGEELLGHEVSTSADPASVREVFLHGRRSARTRLCRSDTGRHLEVLRCTYRFTDIARQAIGSDDTEADTRHDADPGSMSAVVQPVERSEHLELVADVEVVHPHAEARLGQRACRVEERSGGIEQQLHVGQRLLHCSCIVGVHNPVG
jgi:hypothetical protein